MNVRTTRYPSRWATLLAAGACLYASACNPTRTTSGSALATGSIQLHPGGAGGPDEQARFIVAPNQGGSATKLRILDVEWGRVVDVYATVTGVNNDEPVLIFDDLLIAADLDPSDSDVDFEPLERELLTGSERLVMKRTFGTPEFATAFTRLTENLQQMIDKSLDVTELPPFTAVARNGAVAITFDDLVDPNTISNSTVSVGVGYPPSALQIARVVPDRTRGDIVGGVFHTTRVLVDFTLSSADAAQFGTVVNPTGLPEAAVVSQPNVVIRIPTRTVPAVQFDVLANLDGHFVATSGNGSTDPFSPSFDVVRAFRSGGRTNVTQDPFNGFLPDSTPPQLLSTLPITVQPTFQNGVDLFADLTFATPACALTPQVGDVVAFNLGLIGVVQAIGATPVGGVVSNVQIELVDTGSGVPNLGVQAAEFRTPWLRSLDQIARPECFVGVQPPPTNGVGGDILTTSTFTLQFSEPMDPGRVNGFDTIQLLYGVATPTLQRQVMGVLNATGDFTRFTLQPLVPLRHTSGTPEAYRLRLPLAAAGPTDFAGNPLPFALLNDIGGGQEPLFTIKASEPTKDSRSLMLNFTSVDEDDPDASPPIPEVRGQLIFDLNNGRVRPRSVQRFSSVVDVNQPIFQLDLASPFPGGAATTRLPFIGQGCRLMTVWRYSDLGFDVMDDAFHNLDIEGLNWAPSNGTLQIDTYPLFQMALSHSLHLPDEGWALDPLGNPFIAAPLSSLSDVFADNVLDPVVDPLLVVHNKALGYFLQPNDLFQGSTGTMLAPWPMNQGVAPEEFQYYTWRDTGIAAVGQPDDGSGFAGTGVPTFAEQPPPTPFVTLYPVGAVPTIGLPLLMDFRVYPSTQISATNQLLGFLAIAGGGVETAPFFTAYSRGGFSGPNTEVQIDPDAQLVAAGGIPAGVAGNMPRNQLILFGQGDFVTRINRAHTRWFECSPGVAGAGFNFAEPVVEPNQASLPVGTQLILQYRGATGMNPVGGNPPWADARNYDAYGNSSVLGPAFTPTFLGGDTGWKVTMAEIAGSQYFQARITMVSNVTSGAAPTLEALGFGFQR